MEQLENRTLLAVSPHVVGILADNRGQVQVTFDADLDKTTVTTANVRLYTVGADKTIGTADDASVAVTLKYSTKADLLTITPVTGLKAGARYRLRLLGANIKGTNGALLDGEFNSVKTPSGNGTPGGTYDVSTTASAFRTIRFTTVAGQMSVKLFADTPITNANFLKYANRADWDTTFFHRLVKGFVVQGGGFKITPANQVDPIAQDPKIQNEPFHSNLRGTIAMAKLDGDANSATNQWFFNLADNSGNLDNQNGGFTAFGKVTDAAGLAVMDKLAKYPLVNAGGVFSELPVLNDDTVFARGYISPKADLIKVTRVALLMAVTATPAPAATPAVAPAVAPLTAPFAMTPPMISTDDDAREQDPEVLA